MDWIAAVEKPGKSFRDESIYPKINNLILHAVPQNILDIGCGQGICSANIDLKQCQYTGVEPSPFLLDRAGQLYPQPNKSFLRGNAYALPVPDRSFGAAFSVMVWHLLSDLARATAELGRVLTSNGRFLIVTANPAAMDAWTGLYPDAKVTGKKLEGSMQLGKALSHDVLYLHTMAELQAAFKNAGLSIESTETFLPTANSNSPDLLISIQGHKLTE